jgi:hypothetical protein
MCLDREGLKYSIEQYKRICWVCGEIVPPELFFCKCLKKELD